MQAKIMMWVEGEPYEYGTYDFNTTDQKNRVNELAMKVRDERDCYTYVEIVKEEK
jgi:hypothetical protein